MKEILFLTYAESAPGFALTGVRQQALLPEAAWETIQQACKDPEVGVIAADSRLLERLDPIRLRELTDRWSGVLVTLPAPADRRTAPSDELQRLVQRALGYHVRLQR
jgi:vacuolar-type H+-ATPase subunit F/Vma7